MRKIFFPFLSILLLGGAAEAQKITWSEDIACIVYTHCTRCHNNTNSIAAIPFTNYDEAWTHRLAIKYYVENKLMPPYQPGTENRHYIYEKNLSQKEIDLITAWVNQGAIKGDTTLAPPPPPILPLISKIASPDFSQRIPVYTIPNIMDFQYHCFVLPGTYNVDKKISQIEILPSNLSAIYNVFLYSDTSSIPITLDAADPGNGYENYSGIGSPTAKLLYGWVNGNPLYQTPPNISLTLEAKSHLVIRILFAEDAANKKDSTMVNLKFNNSTSSRTAAIASFLTHTNNLKNPPFIIPADSIITFYEQTTLTSDITLLGVSHWAHKLCTKMNCYAVTPANDTLPLLQIDDHEHLWSQGFYYFDKLIKIPAGTKLYGEAEYDNTGFNNNNPFSPPHNIMAGMTDTSEQMIFSFSYLPYLANDENILADTVIHQTHYLNCSPAHNTTGIQKYTGTEIDWKLFPNPSTGVLYSTTADDKKYMLKIFNALGEVLYSEESKTGMIIPLTDYPKGIYLVALIPMVPDNGDHALLKKIIKE